MGGFLAPPGLSSGPSAKTLGRLQRRLAAAGRQSSHGQGHECHLQPSSGRVNDNMVQTAVVSTETTSKIEDLMKTSQRQVAKICKISADIAALTLVVWSWRPCRV